jgi:hypothetical protein
MAAATDTSHGFGLGGIMRRLADADSAASFSNRNRSRRFEPFERAVGELAREKGEPVRILDVGGTSSFWEQRGWTNRADVEVVTANIQLELRRYDNVVPVIGDATDLSPFEGEGYDFAFSNSVIEHLRDYDAQRAMARGIRRVAPGYWVQTPNHWFPIEPHFLAPGWHYLPERVRVALLRRRRFGWRGPCPDPTEARALVREIRLLRKREMRELFPDAELVDERFGPFVKSFVAFRA